MSAVRARLAGLGLLLAVAACGQVDVGAALDWTRAASRGHLEADEALARGDLDGARAAVLEIIEAAPPAGLDLRGVRVVRQDACFRLAEIELQAGRAAAARTWAERGLELGDEADVFSGNLHIARGQALERLGLPAEAAASYHRALLVHEALLAAALGVEPDAGGGAP